MKINNIMVIDDSEADQFYVETILKAKYPGVNILNAYDGQEALDILAELETNPDVIFLDINMPRMNGHEFLENYGKTKNPADVIVMLTSSNREEDQKKALAFPYVKKYWNKPITIDTIDDIIFGP